MLCMIHWNDFTWRLATRAIRYVEVIPVDNKAQRNVVQTCMGADHMAVRHFLLAHHAVGWTRNASAIAAERSRHTTVEPANQADSSGPTRRL